MASKNRSSALITGANGGMGRACARLVGASMDLVLTDIADKPLTAFADELKAEGYTVSAALAGDLGDKGLLDQLTKVAGEGGGLGALIHTAGLSPKQSDWATILRVNSIVTRELVDAVEPILQPGSVAVLIASMAGYVDLPMPDADRILARATSAADLAPIKPMLFPSGVAEAGEAAAAGMAYVLSKRSVLRLCEDRAAAWGQRGARIVSVSPGLVFTPMGRKEADSDPRTAATLKAQPINRWGTAMDIAAAVQFLISPAASYVTGCDLRVDGGATALAKASQG